MNGKRWLVCGVCILVVGAVLIVLCGRLGLLPEKTYTAEDFGIERVTSPTDCNQNGVDDYTDILLGARQDARRHPRYHSAYYAGGYPPEDEGVCTDVVWRAFAHAGYSLKDLVDADIAANIGEYPRVEGRPDPNIDFRRVKNLKVYFERNATALGQTKPGRRSLSHPQRGAAQTGGGRPAKLPSANADIGSLSI